MYQLKWLSARYIRFLAPKRQGRCKKIKSKWPGILIFLAWSGQAASILFNKHAYIESVKAGQCKTIGYARKSHTNDTSSVRRRLLGNMTAILVDPCRCSKIFVTPTCAANLPLFERDLERSSLTKEIRHAHGDMQGKKSASIPTSV